MPHLIRAAGLALALLAPVPLRGGRRHVDLRQHPGRAHPGQLRVRPGPGLAGPRAAVRAAPAWRQRRLHQRDGLVLTNHHVAHSWIEKIADPGHDYVKNGYLAADRSRELPVPGLEVRTLMATENVTAALKKAVRPSFTDAEAGRARKEALARLVQAAETRTGFASEPCQLYHGGETWIYSYRVHSDVRLVMAPEFGIAAFGHDWDNFTFPRHDLDFCLFRVYEHGAPYHPDQCLAGPRPGSRPATRPWWRATPPAPPGRAPWPRWRPPGTC